VNAVPLRAPAASRLNRRRLIVIIMGAFAAIVLATIVLAALLAPAAPRAVCPDDRPCGEPPKAEPLVNLEVWRSSELGYSLEYSADNWKILDQGARGVRLGSKEGDFVLAVSGTPGGDPQAALLSALDDTRERILGLDDDTERAHRVLSPSIGLHPGVAGEFVGTVDTPQGTSAPVGLVILAAANQRVTVTVIAATGETSEHNRGVLMSRADSVLNTVRLPGDPGAR
jgi:hypothetical protein